MQAAALGLWKTAHDNSSVSSITLGKTAYKLEMTERPHQPTDNVALVRILAKIYIFTYVFIFIFNKGNVNPGYSMILWNFTDLKAVTLACPEKGIFLF